MKSNTLLSPVSLVCAGISYKAVVPMIALDGCQSSSRSIPGNLVFIFMSVARLARLYGLLEIG